MNKTILGKQLAAIFIVMTFLITAPPPALAAAPTLTITSLPPYGTENAAVTGKVSGVDFSTHYVTAYIQVDEVWWIKPTAANPRCVIGADGAFSCPIRSGQCDVHATAVFVQLMPNTIDPRNCNPCKSRPTNAGAKASTIKYRPYPVKWSFSGYEWRVKKATKPGCRLGPGINYFSDTASDVWVDANKALHLRIRKILDTWYSSEVVLHKPLGQNPPLGYGTYVFRTKSRIDLLDANIVLGMFPWDSKTNHPTHREMDIEVARWGDPNELTNAQFALQPCGQCPGCNNNCSRFRIQLTNTNKYVTFYMKWSPGKVEFSAYRGRYGITPPAIPPIHTWTRTGSGVPTPGKASIRINFWLYRGLPPLNGRGAEVIIEKFLFEPLAP